MREIRFKAMLSGMKFLSAPFDWYDLRLMPQAEFIVQYTGVKDVDGKEIYEGDIVEWESGKDDDTKHWKEEVKFIKGVFYPIYEEDYASYKVIGNIYENPELLLNR